MREGGAMTTRDELVAWALKEFGVSNGTQVWVEFQGSPEMLADAILANWTPQTATEPDEDLVEAVAKAMFTADPAHEGFADEHWEGLCDRHPEVRDILDAYRDMARAALSVIPSRAEVLETWAKNLSLYDEMGDPDPAWVAGIESARRAALDEAARLRENEVKS